MELALDVRAARGRFTLEVRTALPLEGVTAIFGPSGGGKTTLLRAIAGLTPCSGRIAFGERVLLDSEAGICVAAHRREIAVAFQGAHLFPHLDVAGNLRFAWRRVPSARRAGDFFDEVVNAFDLRALLDRPVQRLSGGETQRVALARTLLSRPALLLLDEPLSALDAPRRHEILPYLDALYRRFGVPILYVTHAVDEVARLADRVLVLADGRQRALGTTGEILERLDLEPLTGAFEAGVVLTATVAGYDEYYSLLQLAIEHGPTLVVPARMPPAPGTAMRVRVLARDVALARERPRATSVRNVLEGRVLRLAYGDDRSPYVEVRIATGEQMLRARITRASADELALAEGDVVHALIKSVSLDPA